MKPLEGDVYEGPGGILLQIDVNDADTPVLVWSADRQHTATYYCAVSTGELGCGDGPELTNEQLSWLDKFDEEAGEAFNEARKDDPRYG